MTNDEYLASVSSLNVVGDVVAFRAPKMIVEGIPNVVFRIGEIQSYTPRGEHDGSKVVKTRSGTEYTIKDNDGTKWSYSQWDKRLFPVVRIDGQETPKAIKPALQVLVLPD